MKIRIGVYAASRSIVSKGRDLKFSTIWVYTGTSSHPVECDVFGETGLAFPGEYLVPARVDVYQKRPQVVFDFNAAVPYKASV